MDTIRKKINALKEDNEIKQEEIERLQEFKIKYWLKVFMLQYYLSD